MDERQYLGDTGALRIWPGPVAEYAAHTGQPIAAARRELAAHLAQAVRVRGGGDRERWRFRRRSAQVDISARVRRKGGRAVVESVTVRDYQAPRERSPGRPSGVETRMVSMRLPLDAIATIDAARAAVGGTRTEYLVQAGLTRASMDLRDQLTEPQREAVRRELGAAALAEVGIE